MKKALNKRVIIPAVFGIVLIAAGVIVMNIKKPVQKFSKAFFAMDCPVDITLYSSADFSDDIRNRIKELDGLLSAYDEKSEINRLNAAGSGKKLSISPETSEVLDRSLELYEKYGGCNIMIGAVTQLWDITGEPKVPSDAEIEKALKTVDADNIKLNVKTCQLENGAQADLGCDAKGYALDKVKEILDEQKPEGAVVSFGSSILCYGKKPDGSRFKIGIKDPFYPDTLCAQLECDACFVSTSGGYERFFEADGIRYCHIFDEKTGRPSESTLQSVTVISDSGIESDFLSTRIYLDGKENLSKWLEREDISVIAVDENARVYCSEKIKAQLSLTSEYFQFAD